MIVRDADRVHAACVLVARVVAGVSESIAELRGWTVDVVNAGHRPTAGRDVIRITGVEPGRALAIRHVIVDDAKGVRAARDEVADRLTDERTVRRTTARVVLRALAVGGAAIFARAVTAATVVGIARVAGQALAVAAMVLRDTARICGAGKAAAERQALEHPQSVGSTALAGMTVVVVYAVGHRRLLARRQHWIPLVSVLTFAGRATRYNVRLAFLIGAAHYLAAGIHAVADTAVQSKAEEARMAIGVTFASR